MVRTTVGLGMASLLTWAVALSPTPVVYAAQNTTFIGTFGSEKECHQRGDSLVESRRLISYACLMGTTPSQWNLYGEKSR